MILPNNSFFQIAKNSAFHQKFFTVYIIYLTDILIYLKIISGVKMKFKKVMFICIILLAILAIGAVSASEDVNETVSADENIELSADLSSSNQDAVAIDEEDDEKEDLNYEIDKITEVCNSEDGYLQISILNEDVTGKLKVSVDDNAVYDEQAEYDYQYVTFSTLVKNLKMGSHTLKVDFYDDLKYRDFSESWKFDYTYYVLDDIPSTLMSGDEIRIGFSDGVKGKLTLKIDNGKEMNLGVHSYFDYIPLTEDVKFGKHTYELKFTSSNTKAYKSFTKKGSYNLEYYFVAKAHREDIYYGEDGELSIEIPWDATKKVSVTYGNKTSYYSADEDEGIYVNLADLKFGENKITVTYPGDKKYAEKTKTVIINVHEILDIPSKVGFESGEGIYFRLPEDAKGNLMVTVDNIAASTPLNDGIATFDLSAYGMGKHNVSIDYDGDDYKIAPVNKTVRIVPNFIYKSKVYGPDGVNISIRLPDDANGTFTVSNSQIRKSVDVVNGMGSLQLYGYNEFTGDEFDLAYSDGNYNSFSKKIMITVFDDSPDSLKVFVPEIFVIGDYFQEISIFRGYMAKGAVNVTLNGNAFDTQYLYEEYGAIISYSELADNLTIGNHTIRFEYAGDDYYNAFDKTYSFAVDFYRIGVPNEITSEDSRINVYSDADGNFTCYVDEKEIEALPYEDDEEINYVSFDLSKLAYGEHDVKIVYSGGSKYSAFTKEFKVNVSYDLIDYEGYGDLAYGDSIEFFNKFTAPLNGTAVLIVGDKNYTADVNEGVINTTIDDLPMANNITVIYLGDNSTPAKSFNVPIGVSYKINAPDYINRVEGDSIILKLPADANGNLEVEIVDDEGNVVFSDAQNVSSGEAAVFVRDLKLGHYYVNARYAGDDYRVYDFDGSIRIIPKLTYKKVILVGESSKLLFELPSDADGTLAVSIAGKKLTVNFVNGTANIDVPGLKWGDDPWYYKISYKGDAKYGSYSSDEYEFNVYVNKWTPTIKVTPQKVIIQNNTFTVTFNLPSDASGEIDIENDYGMIKNGVGKVSTKVSQKGKITLGYYYGGNSKYDECSGEFTIDVLKAPTLTMKDVSVFYTSKATFKVKVVDTYGKIVKGKYVTFYVNGKKVKSVKTDKKGYASIKLSKNPGTYKVKAVYKGGVANKKLTVKHLVSLKTATVKKSAKKLVLTATLKKGKKALKYKKITFKFNGKKYTAWTNKKGVAKVTIKKSVLKKLKVGKTVKYQATYKKDTVKISVKVKK